MTTTHAATTHAATSRAATSRAATGFRLRPIDPNVADRLRTAWADSPVHVADEKPSFPCRQCLRDAEVGEELLLVSYDPFDLDSPYRSASPIFLHRQPCMSPTDLHELPEQLTIRQLSVRAFDRNAMMIDAAIVQGDHLDATLGRMFAEGSCDHVHVHNASRGCWAARVDRDD